MVDMRITRGGSEQQRFYNDRKRSRVPADLADIHVIELVHVHAVEPNDRALSGKTRVQTRAEQPGDIAVDDDDARQSRLEVRIDRDRNGFGDRFETLERGCTLPA